MPPQAGNRPTGSPSGFCTGMYCKEGKQEVAWVSPREEVTVNIPNGVTDREKNGYMLNFKSFSFFSFFFLFVTFACLDKETGDENKWRASRSPESRCTNVM